MGVLTFQRSSFILNICSRRRLEPWLNDWEESSLLHDLWKLSFYTKVEFERIVHEAGIPGSGLESLVQPEVVVSQTGVSPRL